MNHSLCQNLDPAPVFCLPSLDKSNHIVFVHAKSFRQAAYSPTRPRPAFLHLLPKTRYISVYFPSSFIFRLLVGGNILGISSWVQEGRNLAPSMIKNKRWLLPHSVRPVDLPQLLIYPIFQQSAGGLGVLAAATERHNNDEQVVTAREMGVDGVVVGVVDVNDDVCAYTPFLLGNESALPRVGVDQAVLLDRFECYVDDRLGRFTGCGPEAASGGEADHDPSWRHFRAVCYFEGC